PATRRYAPRSPTPAPWASTEPSTLRTRRPNPHQPCEDDRKHVREDIMSLHPTLRESIGADLDRIVTDYKDFHRTPELSMQETRTAAAINARLRDLGLTTHTYGGTGVVAVIENGQGPVIGYRADIDGLPIAENTGLDYASTAEGVLPEGERTAVMHGCGHDTHITV